MAKNLDIEPSFLMIVKQILESHLTPNIKVWVFGSRAIAKAKQYSDLDLMLETNDDSKIPTFLLEQLKQEFDESILPWKVDIVDAKDLDDNFLRSINSHKQLLNF